MLPRLAQRGRLPQYWQVCASRNIQVAAGEADRGTRRSVVGVEMDDANAEAAASTIGTMSSPTRTGSVRQESKSCSSPSSSIGLRRPTARGSTNARFYRS